MKRVFLILLSLLLTVSTMTACGSNSSIKKEWSKVILGDTLPTPQKGKLREGSNLDTVFMGGIEKVDESYYIEYKTACIGLGYTVESEETGTTYNAFNADGYRLSLTFYNNQIHITLEAPEQLSKITWPSTGIGAKLPVPESEMGKVTTDTSKTFEVIIGETTHDAYNTYVSACKENGFDLDYTKEDDRYEAKDADGNRLVVTYIGCSRIEVMIQLPKDDASSIPTNTTENEENNASGNTPDGIRKEFKDAMDSYEKFMDEYVAFVKKYNANPTDINLLTDYANYMGKYAEFVKDFEKWESEEMNMAETAYYIDVQARVTKKLLEVAQ